MFTMLLAGTAVGCSSEPLVPPAVGVWVVNVANGETMPASTVTGKTLHYGVLELMEDQNGALEYCTALPVKVGKHILRWRFLDGSHLEFTYFNTTGYEPPVDTASLIGQTMNYRAKVAEPDIGASNWRLVLTGLDPSNDSFFCG
jgi:hypothetical protein